MNINKLKIINDPVHGFIKIPHEILFDVIEHPYFQRLRRIGQTGLLNLIFPGATHTRFHHALGAMHLMFTALETLKQKGISISVEEEKAAMLAILMHDVGHGPFSHALENMLMDDWHHENLSLLLMNRLNDEFNGELTLALEMFQGKYHRKFFNQLISSQLDVDRLDYLKRDSFFTGVSEGNINAERIVSMMNVCEEGELVIDAKGIYSIENFLTARMFMYWQVYYHKTSALAEFLLVKILERAKFLVSQGEDLPATENLRYFLYRENDGATDEDVFRFTQLDDNDIIQAMKLWRDSDDFVLSYFCKCVIERNLPKTIISSQSFDKQFVDDKIQYANDFFGIDNGHLLVHEIKRKLLPYDIEKQPIYLLQKNGQKIRLDQSQDQLLSGLLNTKTERFILTFPREILG